MELQKAICYKSQNGNIIYQSDLGNPNSATNHRITFHICSYSKLVSPIILHFTKMKPLKSKEKCFLFYLNCSFGSCNIPILEGNYEVENGIIMSSRHGLCKLPTYLLKKLKKILWIKGSKMIRWWTTKEKNFRTHLVILKAVPGAFWDWVKIKNKFRFSEDF